MNAIDCFQTTDGSHLPLSNFYPSPINYNGLTYPTVEHFFQAMKTTDQSERERIANASTPGRAKRLGRQVALREDWESIKLAVMRYAIREKFAPETEFAEYLLETGDAYLEEGNTWGDRFWGVDGTGLNMLGLTLMRQRRNLQVGRTE